MSFWYLFLIPTALVLGLAFRALQLHAKQNDLKITATWNRLNDEVLAVSLIVSKNCPGNAEAHKLVIDAGQCLVLGKEKRYTFGPASIAITQTRYEEGFALLDQARKLAGGAR